MLDQLESQGSASAACGAFVSAGRIAEGSFTVVLAALAAVSTFPAENQSSTCLLEGA